VPLSSTEAISRDRRFRVHPGGGVIPLVAMLPGANCQPSAFRSREVTSELAMGFAFDRPQG
jgi:hypothetical protein